MVGPVKLLGVHLIPQPEPIIATEMVGCWVVRLLHHLAILTLTGAITTIGIVRILIEIEDEKVNSYI